VDYRTEAIAFGKRSLLENLRRLLASLHKRSRSVKRCCTCISPASEIPNRRRITDDALGRHLPALQSIPTFEECRARTVRRPVHKHPTQQAGGLTETDPTFRIISAGQFDLHVPLPLSWSERQPCEQFLIELPGDTHLAVISVFFHFSSRIDGLQTAFHNNLFSLFCPDFSALLMTS
jgi:hypothetical protein